MRWLRKHKKELLLVACTIIFALCIAELAVWALVPKLYVDDELGWAWRKPATAEHVVQDNTTNQRTVTAQYLEHGFKRWGDVHTNKTKVLIIGDSFTEMWYVNNGEEWYAQLEHAFPQTEFFVYGVGGFSSVQEYLVLNDTVDLIKPDVILWQFHYNDFMNNYYPADRAYYPLNNHQVRPYLEDGSIVYRVPAPYSWLRTHSRLGSLVLDMYDRAAFQRARATKLSSKLLDMPPGEDLTDAPIWGGNFTRVYDVTDAVFARIRARTNAPIYLFSAEDRFPAHERALCAKNNLTYVSGVPEAVDEAENHGEQVRVPNDGHWNMRGNAVAGEYLVEYFKTQGWR